PSSPNRPPAHRKTDRGRRGRAPTAGRASHTPHTSAFATHSRRTARASASSRRRRSRSRFARSWLPSSSSRSGSRPFLGRGGRGLARCVDLLPFVTEELLGPLL